MQHPVPARRRSRARHFTTVALVVLVALVALLDAEDHPARRWYDDPEQEPDAALRKLGKAHVNDALAREPLSLIGWVLEQGRPFTEVLTAEHMVLDPLTARALGAKGDFDDPSDPTERRPVVVPGLPHAGVLTSPMVLNRFPTTPTNRKRHRARTVYDLFLGVDILRLGDRPIDPTQITDHNPTLFNPDCTVCHGPMDSVAGAFQNWDDRGRFRMEGWFDDMTPPGFGDVALPPSAKGEALRWLAGELAADSRFARGAVQVLATGLFGRRPLNPPGVDDPDHAAGQLAWALEDAQLRAAAEAMTAAKQDLRVAVRHLVLGPLFRLGGVAPGASDVDRRALSRLGADRWLTPEELDHKLAATIGPWADSQGRRHLLRSYRLLYGGIDAKDVIRRVRAPNGAMSAPSSASRGPSASTRTRRRPSTPRRRRRGSRRPCRPGHRRR